MSVEILRDSFGRADSATPGTPDYVYPGSGLAYTEVEASGGSASISGGKLLLQAGTSGGAMSALHFDTGHTSHGVFMKIDAAALNNSNASPFLCVRVPPVPVFYSSGASATFQSSVALGRNSTVTDSNMQLQIWTGNVSMLNSGTIIVGSLVGEWGLVSTKDWIEVFFDGRLVYRVQSSLNLGNTRASAGVANVQNVGTSTSVTVGRLRATRSQASYPNPGMPKMAYDRDGTILRHYDGGGVVQATPILSQTQQLNDTTNNVTVLNPMVGGNGLVYIGFLFPELRDLYGVMVEAVIAGLPLAGVQTSLDSTDGQNGSWSGTIAMSSVSPTASSFLTGVVPVYVTAIKSLRLVFSGGSAGQNASLRTVHIYGVPQVNSNVHRVAFWHPYYDMRLPGEYLDMDDVIRNGTSYREFRIKNMSTVYTMNNITLDIESLDFGTALTDEFSIKRASEGLYVPNTTVATLAPGAISEIVSVRRIVGAAAPFRIDAPRIRSQIASLT